MHLKKKHGEETQSSQRTLNIYSTPLLFRRRSSFSLNSLHPLYKTVYLVLVFFSLLFYLFVNIVLVLAFLHCVIFFAHKAWPHERRVRERNKEWERCSFLHFLPSFLPLLPAHHPFSRLALFAMHAYTWQCRGEKEERRKGGREKGKEEEVRAIKKKRRNWLTIGRWKTWVECFLFLDKVVSLDSWCTAIVFFFPYMIPCPCPCPFLVCTYVSLAGPLNRESQEQLLRTQPCDQKDWPDVPFVRLQLHLLIISPAFFFCVSSSILFLCEKICKHDLTWANVFWSLERGINEAEVS